jgi:hypothetical protein
MRRAQSILAIVALLATPLALLARAVDASSQCSSMCCLSHGRHAAQQKNAMQCQHGELGQVFECTMTSGRHTDYGLIAPIVPTVPSALAFISSPNIYRVIFPQAREVSTAGFLSAPFEPPRIRPSSR